MVISSHVGPMYIETPIDIDREQMRIKMVLKNLIN